MLTKRENYRFLMRRGLLYLLQMASATENGFFIDEMALLKAFIEHKTLSYNDLQDKGIIPNMDKQEHRALFKSSIDKFKNWQLIESIPDSHPRAWKVLQERAKAEYDQLNRDIERKQLVEKYSFENLMHEVNSNAHKLRWINLYRNMAIAAFGMALIVFITGMGLPQMFVAARNLFNHLLHH